MTTHILKIREVDHKIFQAIKDNLKTIDTRAASKNNQKVQEGDILNFVCGNEHLEKTVVKIKYFSSIEEMVKKLDHKKIMPFVSSIEELKEVYFSFPKYRQKISKFGIIAFYLQ